MKNNIKIIVTIIFITAAFAFACGTNETVNKDPAANTAAEKQTYRSKGVIKQIDAENGKLTIDHEDIPGYMSAMEMTQAVADKKMLETSEIGDKIEFEIKRTGPEIVVTKIKKIGEGELAKAFAIYKTNCAECHSENGEGVEGKGISFLKGHTLDHTEADLFVV